MLYILELFLHEEFIGQIKNITFYLSTSFWTLCLKYDVKLFNLGYVRSAS